MVSDECRSRARVDTHQQAKHMWSEHVSERSLLQKGLATPPSAPRSALDTPPVVLVAAREPGGHADDEGDAQTRAQALHMWSEHMSEREVNSRGLSTPPTTKPGAWSAHSHSHNRKSNSPLDSAPLLTLRAAAKLVAASREVAESSAQDVGSESKVADDNKILCTSPAVALWKREMAERTINRDSFEVDAPESSQFTQ
jgi:hypothetical protein